MRNFYTNRLVRGLRTLYSLVGGTCGRTVVLPSRSRVPGPFCEKNFKGGINSDRGRVYIQYGPPLEVSRQASPIATSKSSEIWTYSINGTTEFVFVDRTGDGNYVLVHSTHPDEIENPEWEDEVNRAIPKSNKPYQDQF